MYVADGTPFLRHTHGGYDWTDRYPWDGVRSIAAHDTGAAFTNQYSARTQVGFWGRTGNHLPLLTPPVLTQTQQWLWRDSSALCFDEVGRISRGPL
jgi:hypothetical protein